MNAPELPEGLLPEAQRTPYPLEPTAPPDPVQAAAERLTRSRASLRANLIMQDGEDALRAPPRRSRLPGPLRLAWRKLRQHLEHSTVATIVLEALSGWWQHHPWRHLAEVAGDCLQHRAWPWIRQHRVGVSLALGGGVLALLVLRPWRWHVGQQQRQAMPRRVRHWLLAQLASLPLSTILTAVLVGLSQQAGTTQAPHKTPAPDAP